MRVVVVFPTYNRKELAQRLVDQINMQETEHEYKIFAFIDGSDYTIEGCSNIKYQHHGKQNYWKLYNKMMQTVYDKYDYIIYLADDLTVCDRFIDVAVEMFQKCRDKHNAIALSLLTDKRTTAPNWTRFYPKKKGEFIQTQWVDMAMIVDNDFFRYVGRVPKIDPNRWIRKPNKSSGVGEYLSKRAHQKRLRLFHLKEGLVCSGSNKSVMNPDERILHPLAKYPIVAGMATYKGREKCRVDAYKSIIRQVDELHIYVNDDSPIHESILNDKKVTVHRHPLGDIGDRGKFYLPKKNAHYFTLDDDLIYPHDYVMKTLRGIRKHRRVVSWHGRTLNKDAGRYYNGGHQKYRCLGYVKNDVEVEFPGTGVMAWCSDDFTFDIKDFESSNMADVWAGIKLINANNKAVVLAHKNGWIHHSSKLKITDTIASQKDREKGHIEIIKESCPQLYT